MPGARAAAAAVGLLVIGVAGGFGLARATGSSATTAAARTTVDVLAVGDVVMGRGTTATDGSVTATLVVQGRPGGGGTTT